MSVPALPAPASLGWIMSACQWLLLPACQPVDHACALCRDLKMANVLVADDRYGDLTAAAIADWGGAGDLPEGEDTMDAT